MDLAVKGYPEERRVSATSVVVLGWPLKIRRRVTLLDVRARKSANWIRNFGIRIGSEGRGGRAEFIKRSRRRTCQAWVEALPHGRAEARSSARSLTVERLGIVCARVRRQRRVRVSDLGRHRTTNSELARSRGIRLSN
ncbi:hypothetical protein OUZ56_033924 [Daphnia magna]|uniref:Uncharacterized protein n=1 Tax=Daphnia magna TaxID=35525 RepID=A0ABR0BB96_9CRUS|nr:hypothetical protein OUZ56_033924 [Daphnia magna]